MEPERLWWCGEGGWSERDPGADYGDEYAALRGTKGQAAPTPTDTKNPAPKATSADGCTEQKEP